MRVFEWLVMIVLAVFLVGLGGSLGYYKVELSRLRASDQQCRELVKEQREVILLCLEHLYAPQKQGTPTTCIGALPRPMPSRSM